MRDQIFPVDLRNDLHIVWPKTNKFTRIRHVGEACL